MKVEGRHKGDGKLEQKRCHKAAMKMKTIE